jgi:hypothetical protein
MANVLGSRFRPGRRPIPSIGILLFLLAVGLTVLIAAAADASLRQARPSGGPPASAADLPRLLESAAGYCDRLSRSVLDFVCRERISEWSYPEASLLRYRMTDYVRRGRKESHAYLYDYQLVRDRAGSIRESRTLLTEDKKNVHVPDAALKTRMFWHAKIVMGPLGLLSRERQAEHDFRVVRELQEEEERIAVIEAVPKPGVIADHLVGTIWLRIRDARILKIEWDPSSIDNFIGVTETAERFRMNPRVVLTSEYGIEKNGIRFPSRYTVQETYGRGVRRFQRSETTVVYDQYKFFTVETEVIY